MKGRIIAPLACIFLAAAAVLLVGISRETKTLMQQDPKTIELKLGVMKNSLLLHTQQQQCYPTTSYRLFDIDQDSHAIILQSHYGSFKKTVGGDEFYPTILFKDDIVVAVGHVTDLFNGQYAVVFKSLVPLDYYNNDTNIDTTDDLLYKITYTKSHNAFSIKNILQYSCGDGILPPPTKEFRFDSGALNREVPIQYPSPWLPVEKPSDPTKESSPQPQINLKNFDRVLALGDSMMEQLVSGGLHGKNQVAPPWTYTRIQAPLSSDKMNQAFMIPVRKACKTPNAGDVILGSHRLVAGDACSTNRTLLLLNSGVWDLLEDGSMQSPSVSKTCCNYDADFDDHLTALRRLLSSIQHEFPYVTIGWKSMTASHIHRADCANNNERCKIRTKYMSTSRSAMILQKQMNLIEREFPDVLFANIYDLTYSRAHHSRPGDGRHFCCKFNPKDINTKCSEGADVCGEMWHDAFGDSGWAMT
eukprot:15366385-Ditylum_brightwellii.AAC.1